jgi:lycopene beta-cyclase
MAPKHYDYIITGAGCAGLSLLMRMMEDPFFLRKNIGS